MKIRCLIVDDDQNCVDILSRFIHRVDYAELAGVANDPAEALDFLNIEARVDVTFVDVEMPGMNGIELAKIIRTVTSIIFTTAHAEYGAESYNLDAIDYLLKPIEFDRFEESLKKLIRRKVPYGMPDEDAQRVLAIKKDGILHKVKFSEVIYLESRLNYVKIGLDQKSFHLLKSLKELLANELYRTDFIQVHKSFVINLRHFTSLTKGNLQMSNGEIIPLGRKFKRSFLEKIHSIG